MASSWNKNLGFPKKTSSSFLRVTLLGVGIRDLFKGCWWPPFGWSFQVTWKKLELLHELWKTSIFANGLCWIPLVSYYKTGILGFLLGDFFYRKDPIGFSIIKSPFGSFGIFCLNFFHPHLTQSQIQKKMERYEDDARIFMKWLGGFVQRLGFQTPCCDQSIGPCIKGIQNICYGSSTFPPQRTPAEIRALWKHGFP